VQYLKGFFSQFGKVNALALDFGEMEKKWQKKWKDERLFEPEVDPKKKPFYL